MPEKYEQNPTGRFSGLAETYARNRPTYPSDAVDFIVSLCGLKKGAIVADIGCGTGISSRLFAERGFDVLGVEPNDDMRSKAEQARLDSAAGAGVGELTYLSGKAEETGLNDQTVDLVLSAQAFHWFDPAKTLPEFVRILKPNGYVVLMWNERDEADPFTQMYGDLFRSLPDTAGVEVPRGKAGDALLQSILFQHAQRDLFMSNQLMDEDGLVGRAFSASYAPKDEPRKGRFEKSLRTLFHAFAEPVQPNGQRLVRLHYATSVYTAQRL
jgi:ubiquinone/menaquinone biosynthesis C-methylase UbiE